MGISLPQLEQPCNRCGECCKIGGSCELRRLDPMMPGVSFEGRCEFLIDTHDGATECSRLRGVNMEAAWVKRLIDGTCDFPELRIEVGEDAK